VEESENFDARSLQETYEHLSNGPLKDFRLAMIHGRMSTEEKERIMFDFRTGEIQILVATTVIEVGVDVPNANLLTIESAERFGLSQLHQLRGRIGRGKHPGYCTVFHNATSAETLRRLKAFEKTSDGFKLAEKDFEIRGSGDLFGTQQHGIPPFRIADLVRDRDVLLEARSDAVELVRSDPGLSQPEHAKLRKQMLSRYGAVLNLGDVG
jgi:ATP-dependent DNA helicase RecG